MERMLAKCHDFDVEIEDHGMLIMGGYFEYEEGSCQGFGYCIESTFIQRFIKVFGWGGTLRSVNGKSCWVTASQGKIHKIEPLHKKDGTAFDVDAWAEELQNKEKK